MNNFAVTANDSPTAPGPDQATCEGMWTCGRGPTLLRCHIRHRADDDLDVEVVRNGRLYGTYHFIERVAAVTFASRLRQTFEANGWMAA